MLPPMCLLPVSPPHSLLTAALMFCCPLAVCCAQLLSYNPNERPSATDALLHPFFEQMLMVAPESPPGTGSVLVAAPAAAATAVRSLSNSVSSTVGTVSKRVTEVIPAGGRGVIVSMDMSCLGDM